MTQAESGYSYFQSLSVEVDAGNLRLVPGVAESCVTACGVFVESLQDLKNLAKSMSMRSAYGTLSSAQDLAAKFERKAIGEGGFESVLQQHIDTVKHMQDVFDRAGKAYATAEDSNARAIGAAGSGLPD